MPKLSLDTRDVIVARNLELVSAARADITDEMMVLATQLSRIHGRIRVTKESSGIQFYMPSPTCLAEEGEDELYKMHLAVNPQKYLDGQDWCGCCMKTSTPYRMTDLLSMPPLSERGFDVKREVIKVDKVTVSDLEYDTNGALIPKGPGTVVPVYRLPKYHPAQQYLRSRNFDPEQLWEQFRLSYCVEERKDVYYGKMLNGFKKSPQGRLVFFIDIDGINRGWQTRILEFDKDDVRSYWHPYTQRWTPVLKKVGGKWVAFEDRWIGWEPHKYVIGAGCHRNQCLLGYEAAVAWNKAHDDGKGSWCVLAEGGLDAGRIGPPGLSMMGKFLGEGQSQLAASTFSRILYVGDNDEAGRKAVETIEKRFAALTHLFKPQLKIVFPPSGKDLGDMAPEAAQRFILEEYDKF